MKTTSSSAVTKKQKTGIWCLLGIWYRLTDKNSISGDIFLILKKLHFQKLVVRCYFQSDNSAPQLLFTDYYLWLIRKSYKFLWISLINSNFTNRFYILQMFVNILFTILLNHIKMRLLLFSFHFLVSFLSALSKLAEKVWEWLTKLLTYERNTERSNMRLNFDQIYSLFLKSKIF